MNHNVTAIGFGAADNTGTFAAVAGPTGETDVIDTQLGHTYAAIDSVGDYMGIAGTLVTLTEQGWDPAEQPAPGDTITVIGSIGSIPDYQRGLMLVVNADGVAHLPNAGHFAAVLSAG